MADLTYARFLLATLILASFLSCSDGNLKQKEPVFKKIPEIDAIKPQKPVKIKLKRSTRGAYSWEISGDNADKVLEADEKLSKLVGDSKQ